MSRAMMVVLVKVTEADYRLVGWPSFRKENEEVRSGLEKRVLGFTHKSNGSDCWKCGIAVHLERKREKHRIQGLLRSSDLVRELIKREEGKAGQDRTGQEKAKTAAVHIDEL